MKQLIYKTSINAPAAQVWKTMLSPGTYRKWANVAWPGSSYNGNWGTGENVQFVSPGGSGTLAKIEQFEPYRLIVARHIAVLLPGAVEDRGSDIAKGWIGTMEQYTFTETDGITVLTVTLNINPDWEAMFNDGWPKALAALKALAETSAVVIAG